MANWAFRSLLKGVRTTRWPAETGCPDGASPGRPLSSNAPDSHALVDRCPTSALSPSGPGLSVDHSSCVHCQRCRHGATRLQWRRDVEWARASSGAPEPLPRQFKRSLNVLYIDAGACGGCMSEVRLIDAPSYNFHRFGIFITATPRDADVLLVAGPVTEAMRTPLLLSYQAMPEPKRVVAMGVCAINGGVFGTSFASAGGVAEIIPVDVVIPGCPPPPLAIIHGLQLVAGQIDVSDETT